MKTAARLVIYAAFAFTAAHAQEPTPAAAPATPEQALQTIVENEKKFYEMGLEQGSRAAFLHYLAPDAIAFEPGPQNARKIWEKRPPEGMSLKWWPVFAAVSASGDLAYTTGPSEWRENKTDEQPIGHGRYITIWKRQKDGDWKVAVDVGNTVPGAPRTEEQLEIAAPNESAGEQQKPGAIAKRFRETEAEFISMSKNDSTDAMMHAAHQDIRVFREGVYPAAGRAAAGLMLSVRRGKLTFQRLGGDTSAAGDLLYNYGKYRLSRVEQNEHGHYLHIWRLDKDGAWKLALDYQSPLPADEKKGSE